MTLPRWCLSLTVLALASQSTPVPAQEREPEPERTPQPKVWTEEDFPEEGDEPTEEPTPQIPTRDRPLEDKPKAKPSPSPKPSPKQGKNQTPPSQPEGEKPEGEEKEDETYSATDGEENDRTKDQASSEHARQRRKWGVYLSGAGDPFPIPIGINGAYNVARFARITAGFGWFSLPWVDTSVTTFGAGAKFFVPMWELTPALGINVAHLNLKTPGGLFKRVFERFDFDTSITHAYLSIGGDYLAKSGFNVGLGYNLSLLNPVIGFPYLNVGWFF